MRLVDSCRHVRVIESGVLSTEILVDLLATHAEFDVIDREFLDVCAYNCTRLIGSVREGGNSTLEGTACRRDLQAICKMSRARLE